MTNAYISTQGRRQNSHIQTTYKPQKILCEVTYFSPNQHICDLSHSLCWSPLTDLGHITSVTYVCHPLWFVCGHSKGILMSPLNYTHVGPYPHAPGSGSDTRVDTQSHTPPQLVFYMYQPGCISHGPQRS